MQTVKVPAPAAIDVALLRVELVAAGFPPVSGERQGSEIVVAFDVEVDALDIARVVAAHSPTGFLDLEVVESKCEAVWRGEDTFTNAQAQRLLARLCLFVLRRLRS